MLCFFQCRFLREGILAGDERQAGTGIPFHSNLPHIVHIGNRAFCTGRWGLWVVHGMQGDAGSGRVLPPQEFNLFHVGRWFKCSSPFLVIPISGFLLLFFFFSLFPPPLFFLLCCLQALFHLNGVGFNIPAQLGGMAQLFELLCEEADLLGTGFVAVELLALL